MIDEVQLQWIHHLQAALRSIWMDRFFKAWDYVDSVYFVVFVISFVWYFLSRQLGSRIFYIGILSLLFNYLLKSFFHQPRPCQIDPLVGLLCHKSFGFPSGAAQSATLYFGLVWIECQRTLYRSLALGFALMLCFSRVYLGLHFPTDILGGIVVGLFLLGIYKNLFPLCEKKWKIWALTFPLIFLGLGTLFSIPWAMVFYFTFSTLGIGIGLIHSQKYSLKTPKSLYIRSLQFLSVIAGLGIFFVAEKIAPSWAILWNFGQGYWLSFLGGFLIEKKNK